MKSKCNLPHASIFHIKFEHFLISKNILIFTADTIISKLLSMLAGGHRHVQTPRFKLIHAASILVCLLISIVAAEIAHHVLFHVLDLILNPRLDPFYDFRSWFLRGVQLAILAFIYCGVCNRLERSSIKTLFFLS